MLRPQTIGVYLFGMVAAIAVPLLAFALFLLAQMESSEKAASFRRFGREALTLSSSVGRQIQDTKTTLRLLASSPEFETNDLEPFYNRTKAALKGTSMFVLVARADGQQLLNTRVPFATPLGKTANLEALESVLRTGDVEVSNVFFGKTSGKWVFNVTMALGQETPSGAAALILTQNADDLERLMGPLAATASAVLVDDTRTILASAGNADGKAGDLYSSLPASSFWSASGVFEDGLNTVAFAQPSETPWRLILWGPTRTVTGDFLTDWWLPVLAGLGLIAFALGAAFMLGRRLSGSIRGIAEMAARLGSGEVVSPIKTAIVEVNQVGVALTEASYDRSEVEQKLWYTMREAVHRTKNMMSVVQAMMRQTARHSTTVEDFRSKMQGRIAGLAQTVDLLTAGEWEGSSMRQLAQTQTKTFDIEGERISVAGDDFTIKPEVVQALGMALHELATNAVKYGALSNRDGHVEFSWGTNHLDKEEICFRWVETGGPRIQLPEQSGFGTALLDGYVAAAINGRVTLEYLPSGLIWQLTAPRSAVEAIRVQQQVVGS